MILAGCHVLTRQTGGADKITSNVRQDSCSWLSSCFYPCNLTVHSYISLIVTRYRTMSTCCSVCAHQESSSYFKISPTSCFQSVKILTYREPQNPEYRGFVNNLKTDARKMFNYTIEDSLVRSVCRHIFVICWGPFLA